MRKDNYNCAKNDEKNNIRDLFTIDTILWCCNFRLN